MMYRRRGFYAFAIVCSLVVVTCQQVADTIPFDPIIAAVATLDIAGSSPLSAPVGALSWSTATWSSLDPSATNLASAHIAFTMTPRTAAIVISNSFTGPTGTSISVTINGAIAFANITQWATGTPPFYVALGPPVNYVVVHDQTGEQLSSGTSWVEQIDEIITMSIASEGAATFTRARAVYQCAFKTSGDAQWTTGWTAPSSDFGVDCVIKKPLADLVVQLVEVQRAWTIFGTAPTALDHTGGPFTITVAPWFTSVRLSNTTKTELFVGDGVTIGGALSVPSKYQCVFTLPGGPPVISVSSISVSPVDFSTIVCTLPGEITSSIIGAVTGTLLKVTLQSISTDGTQVTSVTWRSPASIPTFTFNSGGAPVPPWPSSTGSSSPSSSSSTGTVVPEENDDGFSGEDIALCVGAICLVGIVGAVAIRYHKKKKDSSRERLVAASDNSAAVSTEVRAYGASPRASSSSATSSYSTSRSVGTGKKKSKKPKDGSASYSFSNTENSNLV